MTRKQRRLILIGSSLGVLALRSRWCCSRCGIRSCSSIRRPTSSRSMSRRAARIRLGGLVKEGSLERGDNLQRPLRGDRRQQGHCRSPITGIAARPVPRRAGRGGRRRARAGRHVQGRQRARQARRDLHAERGRRRPEEAGPLEGPTAAATASRRAQERTREPCR